MLTISLLPAVRVVMTTVVVSGTIAALVVGVNVLLVDFVPDSIFTVPPVTVVVVVVVIWLP